MKKFFLLVFLLAAVVFGAGCIAEADDAAGIYKLESTELTKDGVTSTQNIGDINRFGNPMTPDDIVIELRDDGTFLYTSIHRDVPAEGTWMSGEATFEIPGDSEGESLVGTISEGVVFIHHKNPASGIEQVMTLTKVQYADAGL